MCQIRRNAAAVFESARCVPPRGRIVFSTLLLLTPISTTDQTGPDDLAQTRQSTNGQMPVAAHRGNQNGQYSYVPVPIDSVNLELTALGWETESFLSSLNAGFMEGFQEADLFC